MKKLQKGFSLVELLVVVAIIGVLAGVGIVGYQSYTDSAKSRVALANFNSVKRFVDTELTLLNNNIQTVSGALSSTSTADCSGTFAPYTIHSDGLEDFLKGVACILIQVQMVMEMLLKTRTMQVVEIRLFTIRQLLLTK